MLAEELITLCIHGPDLLRYCRESVDGVEPETLFIYDLELPRDFVPRPHDGEVEEFQLWTVEKVSTDFMPIVLSVDMNVVVTVHDSIIWIHVYLKSHWPYVQRPECTCG